jgi:hypothetical protein
MPKESLFIEEEVLLRQTGLTAEKRHNFSFDRWIALKNLQTFPESVFLVVPLESLLGEEVMSCQTGITVERCHNF